MKLVVVKVVKADEKDLWTILKKEGFRYVDKGIRVKTVVANADMYVQYISGILKNYGEVDIKVFEL